MVMAPTTLQELATDSGGVEPKALSEYLSEVRRYDHKGLIVIQGDKTTC